ncbi:rod shape-determining protein MreC [Candidatus Uhrbacteria bacterium]|nr:rod shape-determining protein MreC [Candidatus Uhrbacteria bacterium]
MRLSLRSIIVVFISIAALSIAHISPIVQPLEAKLMDGVVAALRPFIVLRNTLSESIRGKGTLEKELAECRERRAQLESENARSLLLEAENVALRKELQFSKRAPLSYISAHVLSSANGLGRQMITIDKGSRDGITDGSIVLADGGSVVGKVYTTQQTTSTVLLLTDSHSRIIAQIVAKEGATGVVRGEFQLGLRMDLIPVTQSIMHSDLVVTAGVEKGIPPGLVIGAVDVLTTRPSDLYQTARVKPALSYNDVRIVSVIPKESN